ncbi:leukocyte-specific transcript 1 protein [Paroedura picta]|uniref:leukocyte-specific transcript 1 protein n=1 Tax=Paroedura picta TaxID=143630 RepID=UPI004056703E
MVLHRCDISGNGKYSENQGFCVAVWQLGLTAAVGFVMLVTILILSICLCRLCKRVKKQKLLNVVADNPEEAELHYAELQNLPDSNRGQCDGGTCPAPPTVLNTEYASVAELQGSNWEEGCPKEEKEDSGLDDGPKENESLQEQE